MENTVNTMTITLDEYKRMIDEVSLLQSRIAGKDGVINSLGSEMGRLNAEIDRLEEKVAESLTSVFIQGADRYCSSPYGSYVKLSKESPELEKLIKEATNKAQETTIKAQEDTIKSQLKTIESLQDRIERAERQVNKDVRDLKERHTAKVEELNKTIDTLTKDYEDLKLDKAANIVEAERLEEVNKLKEQIAALEISKEASDIIWPTGLFSKLFHKQIAKNAELLFQQYKNRVDWREVTTTSAIGKAKDYLKTLENKSANNWIDYNSYKAMSTSASIRW